MFLCSDHNVTFVCPLVRTTTSHSSVSIYGSQRHICMSPCKDHTVTFVCSLVWVTPSYLYVHLYGSHRHICMSTCTDHDFTFVCFHLWITTSHLYVSLYGSNRHITFVCTFYGSRWITPLHLYVPLSLYHAVTFVCSLVSVTVSHLYLLFYGLRRHIRMFPLMDHNVTFV